MNQPTKKTHYNKDGSIYSESWWLNGKQHRVDGPAVTYYFTDGSVESELWYLNGERHRVDGPAYIHYSKDGSVSSERWYLNNKELTKEEFLVSEEYQNYLADIEIERMLDE